MTMPCPGVYLDPAADVLLARHSAPRRALFLDRDGVINIDHGYVHAPDQTVFVDGIFSLCEAARDEGYVMVVVTNQAGIARGLYSEPQFVAYTRWLHAEFARRGAPLLATYYCPHHPTAGMGEYRLDCDCRKPAPGMLLEAIRDQAIDPARSLIIGDKTGDIEAGLAAGIGHCILLGEQQLPVSQHATVMRSSSLSDISRIFRPPAT